MEKKNLRTCVGGILILAGTAASIVIPLLTGLITIASMADNAYFDSGMYMQSTLSNAVTNLLYSLPVIALGVVLLLKLKGIPVLVCSALAAVVNLVNIILATIASKELGYTVDQTTKYFILGANVLMTAVAVIPLVPGITKLKSLWFLPGAAYAVGAVIYAVQLVKTTLVTSGMGLDSAYAAGFAIGAIFGVILVVIPTYGLMTAAYFLAGKWIVNPYKKGYQPQPQYAQYQQPQQYPQYQQPYTQPQQPQYDEQTTQALNYYKWQYETGAITWEQYNASVQQLLRR